MWYWSRRIRRCTVVRASWSRSKYTSPYWQDPRFTRRQRRLLVLMLLCYGTAALVLTAGAVGYFRAWAW